MTVIPTSECLQPKHNSLHPTASIDTSEDTITIHNDDDNDTLLCSHPSTVETQSRTTDDAVRVYDILCGRKWSDIEEDE